MTAPRMLAVPLTLGTFVLAACGGADTADEETMSAEGEMAAETGEAMQETMLPDTTPEAVWQALQAESYRDSWALWPDKGELYTGGEPHGMLLTTYLNESAMEALQTQAGAIPVGGILVKENFMPDSTLAAVTVMLKREQSYNPEHNGWWFMKRLADGTVEASGRVAGCQDCHGGAADNDYILTGSLGGN